MREILGKLIILLFLIVFCIVYQSIAAEVTLDWIHNGQNTAGYKIYSSPTSGQYGNHPVVVPIDRFIPVDNVYVYKIPFSVNNPLYFVVTAYNAERESERSNEVYSGIIVPEIDPNYLDAPHSLTIKITGNDIN